MSAVVLGLAVAVGLSTTLVTIASELTRTSVNIPNSDQLNWVSRVPDATGRSRPLSSADLDVVAAVVGKNESVGVLATSIRSLDGVTLARPASAEFVSAGYFALLSTGFEVGSAPDVGADAVPAAVLSRAAWRQFFDRDPRIVGRTIQLNGRTFRVSGVTAPGFTGTRATGPAMWLPLPAYDPDWRDGERLRPSSAFPLRVLVRVPDRVPHALIASRLEPALGRIALTPLDDGAGFKEAAPLWTAVILLCTLIVLLGCANVGTMLTAINTERAHELRTRVSLGANRCRLIQQLLTEGILIAGVAALGGLLLAGWLGPILLAVGMVPHLDFHLGTWHLAGATLLALLSGTLSALGPAWKASAARPVSRGRRSGSLLVAQTAVCLAALGVAGLLTRGAHRAQTLDVGFDADRVWTIGAALTGRLRTPDEGRQRLDRARAVLEGHPSVERVGVGAMSQFSSSSSSIGLLAGTTPVSARLQRVDDGWFQTMGIPIRAGRLFEPNDAGRDDVIVINESLARLAWGTDAAIGGDAGQLHESLRGRTVIGIVGDSLSRSLLDVGSHGHAIYRPLRLDDTMDAALFIRAADPDIHLAEAVGPALAAAFGGERLTALPVADSVDWQRAALRVPARMLSLASGVVLALALIGVAGVAATYVRLHSRDFAVRAALGAGARDLKRAVARQYVPPMMIGILVGTVLAGLIGYTARALLLGVTPLDPLALGLAIGCLGAGAWLATRGPAHRAARINPADLMRS